MLFFKGLNKKRDLEVLNIDELKIVIYKNIRVVDAVGSRRLAWILDTIDMIPNFILSKMVENNLLIRLDNEKGCEYFRKYSSVLAFYTRPNIIYIKNTTRKKSFIMTLLHEIGHFVDNYCVGGGDKFKSLMDINELEAIISIEGKYIIDKYGTYYKTNILEYFAQAFSAYIINDSDFQQKCPLFSKFINNAIISLQ